MTQLAERAPKGPFKWLRGVLAGDGSVFCIPACANTVLRIHPNGTLSMLGEGVLRKCLNFRRHPSLVQLAMQHDMILQRLEEAICRDRDFEWVFYDPAEM